MNQNEIEIKTLFWKNDDQFTCHESDTFKLETAKFSTVYSAADAKNEGEFT